MAWKVSERFYANGIFYRMTTIGRANRRIRRATSNDKRAVAVARKMDFARFGGEDTFAIAT